MDQNFRKRLQKTLYCGEIEPEHCPLALTDLAVDYFHNRVPQSLDYVDLQSASTVTSQVTVSPCSMAMSMMYAERLQRKRPEYIKRMSSSDLFIISMMMASKYIYDEGVDEEVFNDEWAEHVGLDTAEINSMEMDFLDALDWELYIRKEDFEQAMLSIEKRIALREGVKRGWFSYTDLDLLLDETWTQLLGTDQGLEWLQVMAVSSAAYVAGILTIVGSTILVTNACVGLSSVGLLPVLLPALHTSPLVLPASQPVLCPGPMLGCPPLMSPPVTSVFHNDTKQEILGQSPSKGETSVPSDEGKREEAWMGGQSIVDTILSQLMAVLTLKSHLAQFVYAVSDSFASCRERNHSEGRTTHHDPDCCLGAEIRAEDSDDQETSISSALMLRLCAMEETAAELDRMDRPLKFGKNEAPGSGLKPPLSHSLPHHRGRQSWKGCQDGWEWKRGAKEKRSVGRCPRYLHRTEPEPAKSCWDQAKATSHSSLFPDIVIGFSTSMPPPVFAT